MKSLFFIKDKMLLPSVYYAIECGKMDFKRMTHLDVRYNEDVFMGLQERA